MVPLVPSSTVTLINESDVSPLATLPTTQVTVPPETVQPSEEPSDSKVTPVGRMFVTVTLVAPMGPLLVTLAVYVRAVPAATASPPDESVKETAMSVSPITTWVLAVTSVLLVASGSVPSLDAVAVLAMLAGSAKSSFTVTCTVIVAEASAAKAPMVQVKTFPLVLQAPTDEAAEVNVTLSDMVSMIVTPVVADGPLLVTVTV